jgi:hypothetical protein
VQAVTLTIGERPFRLRLTTDVAELSARLTTAVRAGGGMVEIPVCGEGSSVTVLVSPGVSVVLETRKVEPEQIFDEARIMPWLPADDLEF